jgi:hypothetical protein
VLGLGLGLLLLLLLLLRLPGAVGQGAGRGVPLTVHDRQRPGKGYFHQPRRVKKIIKSTAATPQGKTRIFFCIERPK